MTANWTDIEVTLIVHDYFNMLLKELAQIQYSKTEHRNNLKTQINRSDGSIEFKHQNISAVITELGGIPIKGYKNAYNYQALLKEKVIEYITREIPNLEQSFNQFSERNVTISNYQELIIENPPEFNTNTTKVKRERLRKPFKINYLEKEQQNAVLGSKGEEMVLRFEERRLKELGRDDLSTKIEWIGKFDDGAGYDILSKNIDGSDRFIEVKTTKLNKETPIFFSKNEFDFAEKNTYNFNLYRLFDFDYKPKMFMLSGSYDNFCRKEITGFRGFFK